MKEARKILRDKALNLRKKGHSLSEIYVDLNVPKSTVQGWIKDIKLTESQRAKLHRKEIERGCAALSKVNEVNKKRIETWKKNVEDRTDRFKSMLDKKGDIAKLACGLLYLCEGAKYPSSRQLIFGSSDPRMIKVFLNLLRGNFNVDENKLRCRIMRRCDQNEKGLNNYWSKITDVPLSRFYKGYKDMRTMGKPTKKKNYKGVCAVQYNSTDLQYELQSIGESIYF